MLEEDDIKPVLDKILERRGVDFTQYRETTLRRRLGRRLVACNCADVGSYLLLLDSYADELDRLLSDLTIKYSEFFRDSEVYDGIRDLVLPSIIADKPSVDDIIYVWSAGCAAGEETYSLAVTARQMIDSGICPNCITILGTDIDPVALISAQAGCYVKDFMPRPLDERSAVLFHDDGKRITASDSLKELVRFQRHDLTASDAAESMREMWPRQFDLILCRNVLVYLLRETQSKVLSLCYELLRPGGFLVIGTKEVLPKSMESNLEVIDQRCGIFRKNPLPDSGGEP